MALFIPEQPIDFNHSSGERQVFDALHELSYDYYVFHSVEWINCIGNGRKLQGECDFVIVDKRVGVLVIEVKSGKIWCENGKWHHENHNTKEIFSIVSPFTQAK